MVGGKAGSGLDRWIVNQLPPHQVYVEAFLGHGAVCRLKRPARSTIVIDVDPMMVQAAGSWLWPGARAVCGDAVEELPRLGLDRHALVYCDPPYLFYTRRCSDRSYYAHEFGTERQHVKLLDVLTSLPAMVAISGYPSALYDKYLFGYSSAWRKVERTAQTRGGRPARECLWMNYPEPDQLHDPRWAGDGFREREVIKRRRDRWIRRYASMPAADRSAILAGILETEKSLTGRAQLWQMIENVRRQVSPEPAGEDPG